FLPVQHSLHAKNPIHIGSHTANFTPRHLQPPRPKNLSRITCPTLPSCSPPVAVRVCKEHYPTKFSRLSTVARSLDIPPPPSANAPQSISSPSPAATNRKNLR